MDMNNSTMAYGMRSSILNALDEVRHAMCHAAEYDLLDLVRQNMLT